MTSTLTSPAVSGLLARLFADEETQIGELVDRSVALRRPDGPDAVSPALFKDMYLAVDAEVGRLLHVLCRSLKARTVVEFGTSFGISGIYIATALRDNGGGRLITSEIEPGKAEVATRNFEAAGVSDLVEIRLGNIMETFASLPDDIDVAYLDGWPDLYLPALKLIEPRLRPGALVIGDYLPQESFVDPGQLNPYIDYIADPANGYVSVDLPMGDTISIALRTG